MSRVGPALTLIVAAVTVGGPMPIGAGAATRAQGVAVVELELVDSSRPTAAANGRPALPTRALPTTVYLPAGGEPAPLVVLAHGAGGSPAKFVDLATAWAAAGYVVAAPRFPLTNADAGPAVVGDVGEQCRDVRFVLDEVLAQAASAGGPLAGRVDPERIGLYGLSLGSLTMWLAALDEPPDGRVDALIQSDGATLVDDIGAVPFPVLVAHSDTDPIFPYLDVVARYDELPGPKVLLTMFGAAHAAVAEDTPTPADAAYRDVTTAFWDRTIGGRPGSALPAPVEGVTAVVDGARPVELPPTQ